MEYITEIVPYLFTLLGGGVLVAIIQVIAGKKREKVDVSSTLVKTAMELEAISSTRYLDIVQELSEAKSLIISAEKKIQAYRKYNEELISLLKKHNIPVPEMKWE